MRNPDFFTMDRLGVNPTFYEIPLQKATGENSVDIVTRARRFYTGYSLGPGTLQMNAMSKGPTLVPMISRLCRQTPAVK